eukprot:TRINITY_DN3215_c0_g1_i2.p1 TRINITY_DN3215_c0_g1~~TRINITY_DN3215_c0_g1_i2.p1  ORF type:complete len:447 (+),score=63.60 TRINITY_DN3215_c0_g1_i2:157-1497(+)
MLGGIKGHIETMNAAILLLVLLTLSGTVLSWEWQIHVMIYMIAREAILPYDIYSVCNKCLQWKSDADNKLQKKEQAEAKARREAEKNAKRRPAKKEVKMEEKKEKKKEISEEERRKIKAKILAEEKQRLLCEKVIKGLEFSTLEFIRKRLKILSYIDLILNAKKLVNKAIRELAYQAKNIAKKPSGARIYSFEKKGRKYLNRSHKFDYLMGINWAADVPSKEFPGNFHFLNQVYDGVNPKKIVEILNKKDNVIAAYKKAYNFLMQLRKKEIEPNVDKSHMMAYLIHLMGDMHQPLHMVTRRAEGDKRREGDNNGARTEVMVHVNNPPEPVSIYKSSLYKFWNKAGNIYKLSSTLKKESMDYYVGAVRNIMKKYPIANFTSELKINNFDEFAEEMFYYGTHIVYGGLPKYDIMWLSKRAEMMCPKLIALAGYRLAGAFVEIFEENNP